MSLKSIAEEVGVSISTVSRVLNQENTSAASKELQRKIRSVAQAQGYVPSHTAKRLKKSKTHTPSAPRTLCCLYACPPQETKDDPFYSKLLESIEREALNHNYIVKYSFLPTALNHLDVVFDLPADSPEYVIVLGRFEQELFDKFQKYFKKIVYIGLNTLDIPCDQIICNGFDMAHDAISYLHSLNHRKIGFLGGHEARFRGYIASMQELDLTVDDTYIVNDIPLSMEGGYEGMLRLLEKAPDMTAVFCANDMAAIGALRACHDKGLRIPDDISLLGINDIENIRYTTPALSSIREPLDEMGRMGVNLLLDRIDRSHSSYVKVFFPFNIIKRESCKKLSPEKK